ncbi:hypothetical protein [uncultured Algibacter sp.]|uniref:hypothetical protein n=1 Tax=uncultured Algibacter sp. TaxID=298659 RepID=UPI00321657D4
MKVEGTTVTDKEKQVLSILRDKNYSSVRILKSNGEINIIEGVEKICEKKKIIALLNEHNYQNIEIIQSDKKIVHINRTVRVKVKAKNR